MTTYGIYTKVNIIMSFTAEEIEKQIPFYLTQDQKIYLTKELKNFPNINSPYCTYSQNMMEEIYQGDGWAGLYIFEFESGQKKQVQGILYSNTCDICQENSRLRKQKIMFAPIIKLDNYIKLLKHSGITIERINDQIKAIRNQEITNIFYIPKCGNLTDDFIVLLDDIHSIPYNSFIEKIDKKKIFTLTQTGFYIFLLKLSVHFCRFHENIFRGFGDNGAIN